jgi:hypothetical protein
LRRGHFCEGGTFAKEALLRRGHFYEGGTFAKGAQARQAGLLHVRYDRGKLDGLGPADQDEGGEGLELASSVPNV